MSINLFSNVYKDLNNGRLLYRMVEVEVFTTTWDSYYKEIVKTIEEVFGECGIKNEIKTLDINYEENGKILEKHIKTLERRFASVENPVKAIPLVVINGEPFSVGVSPTFKYKFKLKIEKECGTTHASSL